MAVSKKFRWTDADGETIEVDFGADGGNVTIDEKPLTDVLDEIMSKSGNVIAESGEIMTSSAEITLSNRPEIGMYYFIPVQIGVLWDTISWGNAGADEYGTLQGNASVKKGQAAIIKYNGGAGAESGSGAFELIAVFSPRIDGLFSCSVNGSSGSINVDYGDMSSLDVYLGDNTCLYVSDISDVINISLKGSGSNKISLNYNVLTQLNNAKHTHTNKNALDTITADKISDWNAAAEKAGIWANYSTTPQQIGTWIDGTPVWRMGFNVDIESDDQAWVDRSWTPLQSDMFKTNNVFILNGLASIRSSSIPCYIDDPIVHLRGASGFFVWNDITGSYYEGIYGYIEFVTPASNIKTT